MNTIEELEQLIKQSRIISNLPEELEENSEIKIGDWVQCLEDITQKKRVYTSAGYKKGLIFKIIKIDTYENHDNLGETRYVYWQNDNNGGVWDLHIKKTYSRD